MIARLTRDEARALLVLAGVDFWEHSDTNFWVNFIDNSGATPVTRGRQIPVRNGKVYPGDVEAAIEIATTPPNHQTAHS